MESGLISASRNGIGELSENYLQIAYENVFEEYRYFYEVLCEAFIEHLKNLS
jgi:hypothetical protein